MPNLKPDHVEPTPEEDAHLDELIAADPEDPEHWGAQRGSASETAPHILAAHKLGMMYPAHIISPGEMLKAEMANQGISYRQLAALTGRATRILTEIARNRKSVTARTALDLEGALDIPAQVWLHLEAKYRLGLERERRQQLEHDARTG